MKFEKPKKKLIQWYDKKVIIPFDCHVYPEKQVTIANRFTGQECTMPGYAAAVYDTIIGAEQVATAEDEKLGTGGSSYWDVVRAGLDWFKQYFAEQYMVVLD